jgi:hypothetical protein
MCAIAKLFAGVSAAWPMISHLRQAAIIVANGAFRQSTPPDHSLMADEKRDENDQRNQQPPTAEQFSAKRQPCQHACTNTHCQPPVPNADEASFEEHMSSAPAFAARIILR